MPEIAISPLPEAVRRIAAKTPVASRLRTAEWSRVPLALRERAQFSAGVESVRLLGTIQDKLEKRIGMVQEEVAGGTAHVDRSSFIGDLRKIAQEEGLGTGTGGLTDVSSRKRLGLVYDMQTRQAAEFARWKMGEDPDVLDAYPAQELIREEDRIVPRDWRARWAGKGGRFPMGRMVALKSDPVWAAISAFGTPWPPFDFGSGMGIEDVSREEAESLGVLPAGQKVEPQGERDFNESLEASVADVPPDLQDWMEMSFGDKVAIVDGRAEWRPGGQPERTWKENGLPSAREWSALPPAPENIDQKQARARLEEGFEAPAYDGGMVRFGTEVLDHWAAGEKKPGDIAGRLAHLPMAMETVRTPHEVWRQETQKTLVQAFEKAAGGIRACVVAVRQGRVVKTWFLTDAKGLDTARHGMARIWSGVRAAGGSPPGTGT